MSRGTHARAGAGLATILVALGSVGSAQAAEPPLDPARTYLVAGAARASLTGPHCCGASRLVGRFQGGYTIDSGGQATLGDLRLEFDDTVVIFEGLPGFTDGRVPLRCGDVSLVRPATGTFDGVTALSFPAASLTFNAVAFADRLLDGSCDSPSVTFGASNGSGVSAQHDPWSNVFAFTGSFHATIGGEPYDLTVQLDGRFLNRPPLAQVGLLTPQYPQAYCPAYWHWNGSQQWEQVAEANDPTGLKAALVSLGYDPDGDWGGADLVGMSWFDSRDEGPRTSLGAGTPVGPVVFEWGPTHRVELLVSDHQGASAAAHCTFRVIDTTPPSVSPPAALTTACTQPGGATPATSPALQAFLNAASASDLADSAPVAQSAQLAGSDILPTTLFPADGWPRAVSFHFVDHAGNIGSASADVTVVDTQAPSITATLSPSLLYADYKFRVVNATLAGADECGDTVAWRLIAIKSNAPAFDATDIAGAAYGTDDRSFALFTRPAAPGIARVYSIYYEGRDAAGNTALVKASVKVKE